MALTTPRFTKPASLFLALTVSAPLLSEALVLEAVAEDKPVATAETKSESSPDAQEARALVERIIRKMKEAEGPGPMLEFVHWPTVFSKLKESGHLKKIDVSSPEQLQKFYEVFFNDPEAFFRKQMNARIKDLPDEQKQVVKARVDSLVRQLAAKMRNSRAQIKDTTFTVGDATIEGDAATIPLEVVKPDGSKKTEIVELRKIEGKWYLPSMIGEGKEAPASS